jgi:hypothetical protein
VFEGEIIDAPVKVEVPADTDREHARQRALERRREEERLLQQV